MLPNSSDFDSSRRALKAAIQKRLQKGGINDRVLGLIQAAYQDAIRAEGVVLSRTEQNRLLRDILKETLGQMIRDLDESS